MNTRMKLIPHIILLISAFLLQCSGDMLDLYEKQRNRIFYELTPDTDPPVLVSAAATSRDTIQLNFSEELDEASAENIQNYHIQGLNRIEITGATLNPDNQSVTLDVFSDRWEYRMLTGKDYTVLVQNVGDTPDGDQPAPNYMDFSTASFEGLGWIVAEFTPGTTPPSHANSDSASISVSGADIVAYQYSIDGSTWSVETPVATPITLTGLAEGSHTLKVVGKGSAGDWQEINNPTTIIWTVDVTPPVVELSNKPEVVTDVNNASIIVSGIDVVAYKYDLNGSGWSDEIPATARINLSDLEDDIYTVSVIGRDRAGNWTDESEAVAWEWTVVTDSVVAVLLDTPPSTTQDNFAYITVSGMGVSTYIYRLDASDWSIRKGISEPIQLSGLAEGSHTLEVLGMNILGQEQPAFAPTVHTWTVDRIAPSAVYNAPASPSNDQRIYVTVAGSGVVRYRYRIDNGAWSGLNDVTSPISLGGFMEGVHTLDVSGVDAAGNEQHVQGLPTSCSWTLDLTAPTAMLAGTPPVLSNTNAINIDVSGVIAYKYRLDSGSWTAEIDAGTNIVNNSLSEGSHALYVIGRDDAGNWQSIISPATHTWAVDITPPVASLSGLPNNPTNSTVINISVSGPGVTGYRYNLDGAGWTGDATDGIPITTPIQDNALALGIHTLDVIARDAAGNWQPTGSATSFTWEISDSTPIAELGNIPSSLTNDPDISVTVSGSNPAIAFYKYKLDDGAWSATWTAVASPIVINGIADGSHTLYVIGRTAGGITQEESNATTCSWTIDTTPPVAALSGLPNNPTNYTEISVSVAGTGVTAYRYRLDGGPWQGDVTDGIPATAPITASGLSETTHTIDVIARDAAGNWQLAGSATSYSWLIDSHVARAELSIIPTNAYPTNSRTAEITVGPRSLAGYKYQLDSGPWVPVSGEYSINSTIILNSLTDAEHTVRVIGKTPAGDWQYVADATSISWTVDTTRPTSSITTPPASPTNINDIDITIGGTGVVSYKYRVDNEAWSSEYAVATHITRTDLADGYHTVYVIGRDIAGNWQSATAPTSYSWIIDTTGPTATCSPSPGDTSLRYVSLGVAGAGVVKYKYAIDYVPTPGQWSAMPEIDISVLISEINLTLGTHHLYVTGKDSLGNWQTVPTHYQWNIVSVSSPEVNDTGDYDMDVLLRFSWTNPANTAAVKIQIATDPGFSNIVSVPADGMDIGVVQQWDYTVTPSQGSTYYARVKVAGPGPTDWDDWGDPSNGITVAGMISGKVMDTALNNISGATVQLFKMTDVIPGATALFTTTTDASGMFSFDTVPPGENYYKVLVTAGTRYALKQNITVEVGKDTNVGIIYVAPSGSTTAGDITGTIVDANIGNAMSGVAVSVRDWQNVEVANVTSSATGAFTTNDFTSSLPAGTYSVTFSCAGYYDLVVDNVVVNNNKDMGNQALCEYLVEPQLRVIVLWGYEPNDLDLHLVGPTNKVITGDNTGNSPTNRFHTYWSGQKTYNEGNGTYYANADAGGTFSTASLVLDDTTRYGPESMNIFRYGGAQYALGVYTYTLHNWSDGNNWYNTTYSITMRVYDSQGMVREIPFPVASSYLNYWKALKINIQGVTRAKRTVIVNNQSQFGSLDFSTKSTLDW